MNEHDIPQQLKDAIGGHDKASAFFKSLSPTQKNLVVNFVESKAKAGDPDKVIRDAVESLARGGRTEIIEP